MTSAARLDRSEKAGLNGRSSPDGLRQELPFAGEGRLHIFGEQHRNCLARKRSLLVRRSVRTGRFRYQASRRLWGFRGWRRVKLLKGRRMKFWKIRDSASRPPEFTGFRESGATIIAHGFIHGWRVRLPHRPVAGSCCARSTTARNKNQQRKKVDLGVIGTHG